MSESVKKHLAAAQVGESVWVGELREAWACEAGALPVILRLELFDGESCDFELRLPAGDTQEECEFIYSYLCAETYNALSVLGGHRLLAYSDPTETGLTAMLNKLRDLFLSRSSGFGKCAKIADRMGRAFGLGPFSIELADIANYIPHTAAKKEKNAPLAPRLLAAQERLKNGAYLGIDVGGTDIKLAACLNGELVALKEFDWNPEKSPTAEGITGPIIILARAMRVCLAAAARSENSAELERVLERDCPLAQVETIVKNSETRFGIYPLSGIGLSFPDIVIDDIILGGETPKTRGMRDNPKTDYEREFNKLGALREELKKLCVPGGCMRAVNDGHMAAFTAAMELAAGNQLELLKGGVIAHSLGTDLGTGWIRDDGSIPKMPLELYDMLLDIGSLPYRELPAGDLRSTLNENSGLPGLRRYLGQAAAFRMAWELDPGLLRGYTQTDGRLVSVKTSPEDMRKPCLEHLMCLAQNGSPEAAEIFRRIGAALARACGEFEHLVGPTASSRFLFGRFIKKSACFELICEGCACVAPELRLIAANEELAESSLMRQLEFENKGAVAALGQAVGAIYYSAV